MLEIIVVGRHSTDGYSATRSISKLKICQRQQIFSVAIGVTCSNDPQLPHSRYDVRASRGIRQRHNKGENMRRRSQSTHVTRIEPDWQTVGRLVIAYNLTVRKNNDVEETSSHVEYIGTSSVCDVDVDVGQ